jgi:hypothetical protein
MNLLESCVHDVIRILVEEVIDWGIGSVPIVLVVGQLNRRFYLRCDSTYIIVLEKWFYSIGNWIRGMVDIIEVSASRQSVLDEILIIIDADKQAKRTSKEEIIFNFES